MRRGVRRALPLQVPTSQHSEGFTGRRVVPMASSQCLAGEDGDAVCMSPSSSLPREPRGGSHPFAHGRACWAFPGPVGTPTPPPPQWESHLAPLISSSGQHCPEIRFSEKLFALSPVVTVSPRDASLHVTFW